MPCRSNATSSARGFRTSVTQRTDGARRLRASHRSQPQTQRSVAPPTQASRSQRLRPLTTPRRAAAVPYRRPSRRQRWVQPRTEVMALSLGSNLPQSPQQLSAFELVQHFGGFFILSGKIVPLTCCVFTPLLPLSPFIRLFFPVFIYTYMFRVCSFQTVFLYVIDHVINVVCFAII